MLKCCLIVLLAFAAAPAAAQDMQAGEWEFTSTMSSPAFAQPQTATFRNCVKKEDAGDPSRWTTQKEQPNDCKVTPGRKTADSYSWTISCPSSKMQGTGLVKFSGGTSLESDMAMSGEMQGRKFEMRTKMTGKRVGACKS